MSPIHVALLPSKGYLFLREGYRWFVVDPNFQHETATECGGDSVERAIAQGYQFWEKEYFRLVHCGFRYTLPERDEMGSNALFHEMVKSYATSNGTYFDERLGHFCYVDFASEEALSIWRAIR